MVSRASRGNDKRINMPCRALCALSSRRLDPAVETTVRLCLASLFNMRYQRDMKISVFKSRYLFSFRLGFSLLCLFFFSVFCILGTWQLYRFSFKKELVTTYQQRLSSTPEAFENVQSKNPSSIQFQPVLVTGQYLNNLTILQQNKHHDDKVGYEVLTPFQIPGQAKLLLVDRGWLENKNDLLDALASTQIIKGYIKLLNEYQFILGENFLQTTPLILQRIDISEISKELNKDFYPYVLRLDATQIRGFARDWVIVTGLPQRHLAYAIQWFAMALVLLIGYLCFSCERINVKH